MLSEPVVLGVNMMNLFIGKASDEWYPWSIQGHREQDGHVRHPTDV
jgi:hypothetical protein